MPAKRQAKIYSRKRTPLETVIPLDTPFSVEIDVASACNFACTFCFHGDTEQVKSSGVRFGLMEMGLFRKIVNDLKGFPSRIKKVRLFEFGEPLLNRNLPEMIRGVWDAGVAEYVEITTNGALLRPDLNLKLIEAGLSRINISMNGTTEEQYLQSCRHAMKMDDFKANLRHLYEHRKGCHVYIKLSDAGGLSKEEEEKFYAEFGQMCDEIFVERVSPIWRDTRINDKLDDSVGPYGQKLTYKRVCPLIFTRMVINFDGVVVACCVDWKRRYVIGDASKESAVDIWRGERMRELQLRHLRGRRESVDICKGCTALMSCTIDDIDAHAEALLRKLESAEGREP